LAKQGISIGYKTFPIFIDFSNPCQTDFHKKKYFAEKQLINGACKGP
jgi:hypothetical protein